MRDTGIPGKTPSDSPIRPGTIDDTGWMEKKREDDRRFEEDRRLEDKRIEEKKRDEIRHQEDDKRR